MACTISFAAIFLTFFNAVNGSFQPLNPLEQLQKRNPYYGGYAIPQPPLGCSTNLETCQDSFCCPTGTWCGPSTNGAYCCPTEADCFTEVNDLPTCADPSWRLFQDVYPWCCKGTDIGVGGQQCVSPDVTYSADQYAETQTQANTAQPPATRAAATDAAGSSAESAATTTTSAAAGTTTTHGGIGAGATVSIGTGGISATGSVGTGSSGKSRGGRLAVTGGLLGLTSMLIIAMM